MRAHRRRRRTQLAATASATTWNGSITNRGVSVRCRTVTSSAPWRGRGASERQLLGASRNYGYDRARVPLTLGDLLPELSCGLESCDNFDAEVGGGPADEGLARAPSQSVEDLLA